MSYVPSEEALSQYDEPKGSFGHSVKDYEKGLFAQLLQSGAMAGYHLGNSPSYAYEALTGKPGYRLEKPDVTSFIPESEAGQTGQHVGESVSELIPKILGGRLAGAGFRALTQYHPLTKGQMGRQIQGPIDEAEQAGIRRPLSMRNIYELSQLLSHPALESGGSTGQALTPMGIQSILQGASEGRIPTLNSGQSLMGHLERAISKQGENDLVRTRVRPMKDLILNEIQQGMREGGLENSADRFQTARQGARRYYRTNRAVKKIAKPLSLIAILRSAISGVKNLP